MTPGSPFKFPCPVCGQRIAALPEDIGTTGGCPGCGSQFIVPDLNAPDESEPAASKPARGRSRGVVLVAIVLVLGAALAGAIYKKLLPLPGRAAAPIPAAVAAPPSSPAADAQ